RTRVAVHVPWGVGLGRLIQDPVVVHVERRTTEDGPERGVDGDVGTRGRRRDQTEGKRNDDRCSELRGPHCGVLLRDGEILDNRKGAAYRAALLCGVTNGVQPATRRGIIWWTAIAAARRA